MKTHGCCIATIDDDDALQSGTDRRKQALPFRMFGEQRFAMSDLDTFATHGAEQSVTGRLADFANLSEGDVFSLRGMGDGFSQRVFGILLQAGGDLQNLTTLLIGS